MNGSCSDRRENSKRLYTWPTYLRKGRVMGSRWLLHRLAWVLQTLLYTITQTAVQTLSTPLCTAFVLKQVQAIGRSCTWVSVMWKLTAAEIVGGQVAVDTNTNSIHTCRVWSLARLVDVVTNSVGSSRNWYCDTHPQDIFIRADTYKWQIKLKADSPESQFTKQSTMRSALVPHARVVYAIISLSVPSLSTR